MPQLSSEGFSPRGHYVTASFEPIAFSKLEEDEQDRIRHEVEKTLNRVNVPWIDIGKTHPLFVIPVVDEALVSEISAHFRALLPLLDVGTWWVGDKPVETTPEQK